MKKNLFAALFASVFMFQPQPTLPLTPLRLKLL